jgi:hypothetical protein
MGLLLALSTANHFLHAITTDRTQLQVNLLQDSLMPSEAKLGWLEGPLSETKGREPFNRRNGTHDIPSQ